jgi:hypothetical protein
MPIRFFKIPGEAAAVYNIPSSERLDPRLLALLVLNRDIYRHTISYDWHMRFSISWVIGLRCKTFDAID